MKSEIETLKIVCPMCEQAVDVPIMVDQAAGRDRATLTLTPDTRQLVGHLQGHASDPGRLAAQERTEVEKCWHGIPIGAGCSNCDPASRSVSG